MTPAIQMQLRFTGIAQVIIALKVPSGSAGLESMPGGAATSTRADLAEIESHFIVSDRSQASALVRQMARHVVRKAQGGKVKAGLESLSTAIFQVEPPPKVRVYPNLGLMLGTVDRAGIKALRDDPRVASVTAASPISLIRPVAVRADVTPPGDVTWGLRRLGVLDLWDRGLTGKGVLVGHLDTGVDGKHPALKAAIGEFAEFDDLGDMVANAKPHDTGRHGTHTAGTIAGRKVSSTSFGVAPGAKLASAIVIEGGQVIARILAGMDWAVGLGVRVLNMSLGLPGFHEDFLPLVRTLRARNVLPVFAVGNEGPGTSRSPGNYAEVLSVGACDEDDVVADFSSSQEFTRPKDPAVPDLVGPGVEVISCIPGGSFAEMSGSSMATPHIAGLAALLFEAVPAATADQVEAAIFGSCVLPASMTAERANRGVPNGPRALAILQGGEGEAIAPAGAAAAKGGTPRKSAKVKSRAKVKRKKSS